MGDDLKVAQAAEGNFSKPPDKGKQRPRRESGTRTCTVVEYDISDLLQQCILRYHASAGERGGKLVPADTPFIDEKTD